MPILLDISAFSAPDFDPKEWINQTFKAAEHLENKEGQLSSVISKLQLYVQQVNEAVEETSGHVLKNLPRVIHDSSMIQKEAFMLKEKMQEVKLEITKIQVDTAASMAVLEKLDKVKTELQIAKQALHEADNWTVLASDIEDVFESHDIEKIAAKVISMQQSLIVLANSADFKERECQLDNFKIRLEAIASPQIVKSLINKNIEESRKFVEIFTKIGRLPQLLKYYSECEKGSMCSEWNKLVELDQDLSAPEWINSFYHKIFSNWQSQVKWCQQVFGSAEVLPSIYVDILVTLKKVVTGKLDLDLKRQSDQLSILIQLRQATDQFVHNLLTAVNQLGGTAPGVLSQIKRASYSIYLSYVASYGAIEEQRLLRETSQLGCASGDLSELSQSLRHAVPQLSSLFGKALKRCLDFTSGAAFPGLISAIQFSLSRHLEEYKKLKIQIDVEKQTKGEWPIFQACLSLLQNIGDLQSMLDNLDQELLSEASTIRKNLEQGESNIVHFLSEQGLSNLNSFLAVLNDGEASLMGKVRNELKNVAYDAHRLTLDVMLAPVKNQLETAQTAWLSSSNVTQQLPDYSYAPLEYITQIGEYLMTLPQHLEPFLNKEEGESQADALLEQVARQTCTAYTDLLHSTKDVSPNIAKQIAIDIGYLGNVLSDLGLTLSDKLLNIAALLKLPQDTYQLQSAGFPIKLVAMVRQMRNITST